MAVTQFNAHNFSSKVYAVTDTSAAMFTPDTNEIYIVKGLRFTNYDSSSRTVNVKFYSGADTTDYWVLKDHTLAAGTSYDVIVNTPLTISGVAGDRLKVHASASSAVHAVATMMELGRQTGL